MSNAALEGTRTHALLEACVQKDLADPSILVGAEVGYDHEPFHATLSPSARHRWAACPGSVREEARYTKEEGAVFDSFVVDADRATRVQVAIDYIKARIHGHGSRYRVLAEERVDPAPLLGRSDLGGTVDCQVWYGSTYEVIDYKDGMGTVNVVDNLQLEQYALGVIAQVPPWGDTPYDTLRLTIIQPRLSLKGANAVSSVDVPVVDILAKIPVLQAQAAATDDPNAPLVPGESQCKFCRAKGSCSALASKVREELQIMFSPVEMSQQTADRDPSKMSADEIRQTLEAAPIIRSFLEGVEAESLKRLENGQHIPGFKLVRGRGSRKWAFPDEEMVEKLKKMGMPKEAIFSTSLVSPAQAPKASWTKRDGEVVKLTDRQIKTLDEYIVKSAGKLTVAPEADEREAVADAVLLFEAVPVVSDTVPSWLM